MSTPNLLFEPNLPTQFASCEPLQAQRYLSQLFRQHSLRLAKRCNDIEFCHSAVSLGADLSIHHLAYGREIHNAGGPSGDAYLAVFTLAGTLQMRVGAHEIVSPAGTLCVMNPHQSFTTRLSADHQQLTVRISGELLRQELHAYALHSTDPLEFTPVPTNTLDQASTLARVLMTLCHESGRRGSAISRPQVATHFEHAVAALLLSEVPHNYSSDRIADPAPSYVRKARQFIHVNASAPVSVEDIARAVNVTTRTLQTAFRRHLGVTPRLYLRNARLDLARRTLSETQTQRLKVSTIAQDHGFSSASKFARHFRERFGHNPSTLARRRSR
jgi:AraC-like DNA-binding protein